MGQSSEVDKIVWHVHKCGSNFESKENGMRWTQ